MNDLFSPSAHAVDQSLMRGHWESTPVGDDVEAAADAVLRDVCPVPPTPAQLERHTRYYGSEGVEETMRAYGRSSQGNDAATLKAQGMTVKEIAKRLRLAEATVRSRLATSKTAK